MLGLVFNIQRFSIHDGPGIRTTVFLKGCNLRCNWCHNPESFNMKEEIQFFIERCSLCGRCAKVCTQKAISIEGSTLSFDRVKCISCFKCIDACINNARIIIGEFKNSNDIMEIVIKDKPFYDKSGGGVTFSGGEPLLQWEMVLEMLKIAKDNNINTAIETAGNIETSVFESVIKYTDLFLYDIKMLDSARHKLSTNVGNEKILKNLKWLSGNKANVLIRIPIVPGVNDDKKSLQDAADFIINNTNFKRVELLAFHNLAEYKYNSLGLKYAAKDYLIIPKEKILELSDIFSNLGIEVVVHK